MRGEGRKRMSSIVDFAHGPDPGEPRKTSAAAKVVELKKKELRIYGHSKSYTTWLLIAIYGIFAPLVSWGYVSDTTYGIVWTTALILVLLALSQNLSRNVTLFVAAVAIILFFGAGWIGSATGVTILSDISHWFGSRDIPGPKDTAQMVAIASLLGIFLDKVVSRFNDYWVVGGNQIDHIVEGQSETSFPRMNTTVNTTYPNWLAAALTLSGDISFRNPSEKEPRIIRNVPLCPFVAKRVRKRLDVLDVEDVRGRGNS
jgi:hypothetical protein